MSYDMEMEDYREDMEFKKKHKEELEQLMKEMSEEAKKVKEDYKKNPSDMSGSRVHIHENSPLLATREERLLKIDKKA